MEIELPDTISAEMIGLAQDAVAALTSSPPPAGLTKHSVTALSTIIESVAAAVAEDNADLSPSEAAERLRIARPSVMRLISRGELSSRKDGGHYVVSPREVRSFQMRLTSVRREALADLTRLADEVGF